MGKAKDANGNLLMQCQSCHGGMSAVGATTRDGWLDEPGCQNCHHDGIRDLQAVSDLTSGAMKPVSDSRFATNSNTPAAGKSLYRFSSGHGLLQCEACHGATHAIYPSLRDEDNLQSIAAQGHAGTIAECNVCHLTTPQTTNGGPHGMHTVGQSWIENHPDAAEGNAAACAPCHGSDYSGSALSKTFSARSFSVEGGTKTYSAGQPVSCYDCHNGPDGEGEAPTNSGQTGGTGTTASTTTSQGTTVTTTTQAPTTVNAATALSTTCLSCHSNKQSKVKCTSSKWLGHNGSKVTSATFQAVSQYLTGGTCQASTGTSSGLGDDNEKTSEKD